MSHVPASLLSGGLPLSRLGVELGDSTPLGRDGNKQHSGSGRTALELTASETSTSIMNRDLFLRLFQILTVYEKELIDYV